jgi:UDP-galactopyranose mutase
LLSRCAQSRRVFFVEEPIRQTDTTQSVPPAHLEISNPESNLWVVVPHLSAELSDVEADLLQQQLIDTLLKEHQIEQYICWYYTPMAIGFTHHLKPIATIYDCMDELSAFKGASPVMKSQETELMHRANLVFTGGQSLYEAKCDRHPNTYAFPSSVDVPHFAQARTMTDELADQAAIPHPRLGFFGVVDERMNLDLISGIAAARPDWHLVIIGPVVKIDPELLPQQDNIHYLGCKDYKELPAYLAGWDVALLPFALNESTRFISPTKTPEYLAAGKPVVSTSIRDVVRPYGQLDLVQIADTVDEFVAAIETAIQQHSPENKSSAEWLSRVDAFLGQLSWDNTWASMLSLVEEAIAPPQSSTEQEFTQPNGSPNSLLQANGLHTIGLTANGSQTNGSRTNGLQGNGAQTNGSRINGSCTDESESSPLNLNRTEMPGFGQAPAVVTRDYLFDYLVVGAGFSGSVIAERLATQLGKKVLVVDRRSHIGGNAYDHYDQSGILVHKYGPHIFHTNSRDVFEYLSNFTEWRSYEHRVLASVDGQLVPIPINLDTINKLYGLNLSSFQVEEFLASLAEPRENIRTSEDVVVSKVGQVLYEKFFRNYTRKQWGLDPSELDRSVIARIPTRTNRDDRYFTDTYQAMPLYGFTQMFERMLSHPNIKVMLNTDYREIEKGIPCREMVYSGPVDEFFEFRYGKLPYRSLEFKHETHNKPIFQTAPVVNYPNEQLYTRITEFKYLTGQEHNKTSIVYEFPKAEGDPYYPVPRPENAEIYKKYKALADTTPNVHFVGRLATYKYYNMDQCVAQALSVYQQMAAKQRLEAIA